MGRWGALAGRTDDGESGSAPSLEEFIESNHHLFTIIGVFGALSVYLMEFRGSSGRGKGSVGAVLLLFLLWSALAVRNSYRCTERARDHGAYLLVFGYAVFMYAFVTWGRSRWRRGTPSGWAGTSCRPGSSGARRTASASSPACLATTS